MYHKGKYYVTFKRGCEELKKDITLIVNKVFESDSLRITLSDDDDPMFLCVLILTRIDYDDLKKQQGLLVDFDNFPAQLVKLLQQCAINNMFLIMQQTNPLQYYLEVVEHNEFKRLIHLSLKTCPATDTDIKQHMASTIKNLKDLLSSLKLAAASNESSLNTKCVSLENRIKELNLTLAKMQDDKIRQEIEIQKTLEQEREKITQERTNLQKNSEMTMKAHLTSYQETLKRKEKELDELNIRCKQLKDTIFDLEKQLSERSQRLNVLEKEVQKSHIEVATLRANSTGLERDIQEKERQYTHQSSRCTFLEKTAKENADSIKDLKNTIQNLKREKACLEERVAVSESHINKNNEIVQSTTEQLMKANQIISKQNADLIELKEKLMCRTAIALEQEKVIERNSKEIDELKSELNDSKNNLEQLRRELNDLNQKYESSEKTLKDKEETIKNNNMVIQWLHKKLEGCTPVDLPQSNDNHGTKPSSSSSPYFTAKNIRNDSLPYVSDDSINFYATSKLSDVEKSPEIQSTTSKTGLDPKYLKPASNINHATKGSKATPAETQRGKENTNINLPKVDYREKKSSRSNTYRSTPVSAYFP